MPEQYTPSQSETEEISLELVEANLRITNFTEYSFNSHFLTPTDGFHFAIGDEALSDEMKAALKPGVKVQLALNGTVQATGYIDSIEVSASRGSGTVWHVEGRDAFAQAVDSNADPTLSLKDGQSLAAVLQDLFAPFGWSEPEQFDISNEADVDLKSNSFRSKTRRSDAKGFSKRAIKDYQVHQTRPYPREGVFEFASRLSQRHGLWIWSTSDGKKIIVSEPNFTQAPRMSLLRNTRGTTNVLDGSVKFDVSDQPTAIIADSYSRGGEFGPGRVKTIFLNAAVESTDTSEPSYQKYVNAGAKLVKIELIPEASVMKVPRHRVLYLHDDESATQQHLESFVIREMALLQRKSLTAHFTVEGHGQETPDGHLIWTPDTTVKVIDEVSGLEETLYVLSRTFNKSRSNGTTTALELIRLNTLVFSDTGK